jgi:hypothetical protein
MKLPHLTLRDWFWLVALVALGCGWWVDRTRLVAEYWRMVESTADSELFQIDRILSLQGAIEAEGYQLQWSDEQEPRAILHRQTESAE